MPSTKSATKPEFSWRFEALGTHWEIISTKEIASSLRAQITEYAETFDGAYSRFRTDSLVYNMSRETGVFTLPDGGDEIFNFYDTLYEITEGKMTPLVGDTLSSAGYDKDYSLVPENEISNVPQLQETVHRNVLRIELSHPTMIDIGAVGKGYLVDQLVKLMRQAKHDSFVVDGSGDMRVVGNRTEVVGLEHPDSIDEIIGTINLNNRALCASATNRRAWGEWHHVVDPVTARPTRDIIATWVIADSAMIADGLATALFFTAPEKLAATYNYEYLRMHADGSIDYSEYFAKGLF